MSRVINLRTFPSNDYYHSARFFLIGQLTLSSVFIGQMKIKIGKYPSREDSFSEDITFLPHNEEGL